MQIEQIRDVKLLKAMAEAAECHLKRFNKSQTMTEEEVKEIQSLENDLLCIQIRLAEITHVAV